MAINRSRSTEAVGDGKLTRCRCSKILPVPNSCTYLINLSAMFLLLSRLRNAKLGASTPALLEGYVMLGTSVAPSCWTVR